MKITALETIQLPHLNNIPWLHVHTDEGLIGLGETFRGADAVATYLHKDVAPLLIGRNPLEIDAISKTLTETYVGFRSSGVEMRAASAVDIALWDLFGKAVGQPVHQLLGGLSRPCIRTYNTCAGWYRQVGQSSGLWQDLGHEHDTQPLPGLPLSGRNHQSGRLVVSLLQPEPA